MITFDDQGLFAALKRLEGACDEMPQIAEIVKAEALGHAVISANRNVYSTPAGHYRRSGDYLRGFHTAAQASRNTAKIRIWNDVEYAEDVELGSAPNALTPQQVTAYAEASASAQVYLGRTGEKYSLAGPAVIPAAVYAQRRMAELFLRKVQMAWR